MSATSAQALYDETAMRWVRTEPVSLSDFTGRPAVFDLCGDVEGASVLDLGCGEGYCARELVKRGASRVHGIDLSAEMIALAEAEERRIPLNITYARGSVLDADFGADKFDIAVAVFLFNYMPIEAMTKVMGRARRALSPGGRFVFAVPHPAFPFLNKGTPPFFANMGDADYFSGRDQCFPGEIHRIDGTALGIHVHHKTFEDYCTALRVAGYRHLPVVRELTADDTLVARDPAFFGPVRHIPLHLAMAVTA